MKYSRFMWITHVLCGMCLSLAVFAQDNPAPKPTEPTAPAAPTRTADQKLMVRDAQHKLDGIDRQIANFQQQAASVRGQAQAELDRAVAAFKAGVDEKQWQFDPDTLTFTAVPAPAAPTNASTQPAKPASPGSPGAAAPPKVEQAKK